jgi:predicted phage terminase large subunit-like protein
MARGYARGVLGRAMRHGETKVVHAPVVTDAPPPPNAYDESAPLAPQAGPQTRFLSCPADIVLYGGSAGGGKLLAIDTPIPTTRGWRTMGTLNESDHVFDEQGRPCRAVAFSPIVNDAKAYRLTFSDGSEVVACAEHLWHTYTAKDLSRMTRSDPAWRARRRESRPSRSLGNSSEAFRAMINARNTALASRLTKPGPAGAVRTTQAIVDTLRTSRGRTNHAIPVAKRLRLPTRTLALDPYVLGAWLGDGTADGGEITTTDPEILDRIRRAGFPVRARNTSAQTFGILGLYRFLRLLNVRNNKHVPDDYLWASIPQRLALLQGLMDTDGTIQEDGGCTFDNTNRQLAESVFHLVASLGMQPQWGERRAKLYGRDCGPSYRVTFTPTCRVFSLSRKLERIRKTVRRVVRFRYIVDAVEVPPVPMRCLTVDSPSRLYLCGNAMIPTHNTTGLVMEGARHQHVKGFTAAFFRRSYPEILAPKGIWDEAKKVYGRLGWTMRLGDLEWVTPAGGRVVFAHAQTEADVEKWKSAQLALICFDQLETFTAHQFWYLLSRNRSTCGVRPYIRATFNPEPGWLSDFLQWWWDAKTGYPIPERDGVIRYIARINGEIHWGASASELTDRFGPETEPLSVTFIRAGLEDNKILQTLDPGYRAKLLALPIVEQERLLRSNFKIAPSAGKVFPRGKFMLLETMPTDIIRTVRGWDNAATKGGGDFSSAVKLGQRSNGRFIIMHRWRDRVNTADREDMMHQLAMLDGYATEIAIAQEPGSSGKDVVFHTIRGLAGYTVVAYLDTGSKVTRGKPFSVQVSAGNVDVFVWDPDEVEQYLAQMDAFPTASVPDDDVDATTKAFKHLTQAPELQSWGEEDFSVV